MKPGPEKEFDQVLSVAVTGETKKFFIAQGNLLYPNDKRGATSKVIREALKRYRVSETYEDDK